MESVRRAKTEMKGWVEKFSHLSTSNIKIGDFKRKKTKSLVDDYPFENQEVFLGKFIFREESPVGGERKITGSFQIRTESGLFILDTDDLSPEEIIDEINSEIDKNFKIYEGLFPKRKNVWDFINSAEHKLKIDIIHNGEIKPYDEIEDLDVEEIVNNYPVDSAHLHFEIDEELVNVIFTGEGLSIRRPTPKQHEYIIQLFEREVLGS